MISFRRLTEDDFELLADWLGRDHVQAWWRDPAAPSKVAETYGPRVSGDVPTEVFVVRVDATDVGIIQRYRIADHPGWQATLAAVGFDASAFAGIDYLLGDVGALGRGIGTEMVRSFTARLFVELEDVTGVIATPQTANLASCRALASAGYELGWRGTLDSDDPSDRGEAALYIRLRRSFGDDGPLEPRLAPSTP